MTLRLQVLYEYGEELSALCSGHIRLLRPLSHPSVRRFVDATPTRRLELAGAHAVIVERLWWPGSTIGQARELVAATRRAGARLIYAQDDNTFDLRQCASGNEWLTPSRVAVMEYLAQEADGIFTSTEPLRARMSRYNDNIEVVPNALDERLLSRPPLKPDARRHVVIGYMGTPHHDDDLAMIAPALREVCVRHAGRVRIELVSGLKHRLPRELDGLPIRSVPIPAGATDYPLFMSWFTASVRWDIGVAPLRAHAFNVCKSDIKLLDYAAVGAAGIFSGLPPYATVGERGAGRVVANDTSAWSAALDALVADAAERRRLVAVAQAHLWEERVLRCAALGWPEAIGRLLDRSRARRAAPVRRRP